MKLPSKIATMPAPLKMAVLAGGGLIGLMVLGATLGAVGRLLDFAPSEIVQPLPEAQESPIAANSPKDVSGWEESQKALDIAYIGLESQIADLDSQARLGRAARWQQWAVVECNKDPQCPNAQSILSKRLAIASQRINTLIQTSSTSKDAEGKVIVSLRQELSLHARSIAAYRSQRDELLDIAKALSLRPGSSAPINFIPSNGVAESISQIQATAQALGKSTPPAAQLQQEGANEN